jgi:hypothetical protein
VTLNGVLLIAPVLVPLAHGGNTVQFACPNVKRCARPPARSVSSVLNGTLLSEEVLFGTAQTNCAEDNAVDNHSWHPHPFFFALSGSACASSSKALQVKGHLKGCWRWPGPTLLERRFEPPLLYCFDCFFTKSQRETVENPDVVRGDLAVRFDLDLNLN